MDRYPNLSGCGLGVLVCEEVSEMVSFWLRIDVTSESESQPSIGCKVTLAMMAESNFYLYLNEA